MVLLSSNTTDWYSEGIETWLGHDEACETKTFLLDYFNPLCSSELTDQEINLLVNLLVTVLVCVTTVNHVYGFLDAT